MEYEYYAEELGFMAAQEACEQRGLTLAMDFSPAEHAHILQTFENERSVKVKGYRDVKINKTLNE